jgi:hypothetical protein
MLISFCRQCCTTNTPASSAYTRNSPKEPGFHRIRWRIISKSVTEIRNCQRVHQHIATRCYPLDKQYTYITSTHQLATNFSLNTCIFSDMPKPNRPPRIKRGLSGHALCMYTLSRAPGPHHKTNTPPLQRHMSDPGSIETPVVQRHSCPARSFPTNPKQKACRTPSQPPAQMSMTSCH